MLTPQQSAKGGNGGDGIGDVANVGWPLEMFRKLFNNNNNNNDGVLCLI